MNIERISARKYYGSHAIGTVVLVNGHPSHFTDKKDVDGFIKRLKEHEQNKNQSICKH